MLETLTTASPCSSTRSSRRRCASPAPGGSTFVAVVRTRVARCGPRRYNATGRGPHREPDRVRPPRDRVVVEMVARHHHDVRAVHCHRVADARHPAGGQAQQVDAGADGQQLERAQVRRVGVELVARRVADHDRDRAHGGRSQARRAPQPLGAPMRRKCPRGGLDRVPASHLVERRKQDLLDRSLHRAQRQRGLDRRVGSLALVGDERPEQGVRVGDQSLARAREIAEEIDRPSCRASLSAATSPCVNRRCLPGERCGLGNPKRRSQARNVLGLTFNNAAASLVFR